MKIETIAVHAGHTIDPGTGAVAAPIHLSTTFERDLDGTYSRGHMYTRDSNPNRQMLETGIAAIEGGKAAAALRAIPGRRGGGCLSSQTPAASQEVEAQRRPRARCHHLSAPGLGAALTKQVPGCHSSFPAIPQDGPEPVVRQVVSRH